MAGTVDHASGISVVCDVGRKSIRFALTDERGRLRPHTLRSYDGQSQTTVSGALTTFRRDSGLESLPRRCALAIAGVARGETMAITNSRWFISRVGLTSMLQHPPLIINDFAAHAWALTLAEREAVESIAGTVTLPQEQPGTFCILGMGTGLGVAVVTTRSGGGATVLATEAGHTLFRPPTEVTDALVAAGHASGPLVAEDVLSGRGLLAIYRGLARLAALPAGFVTPEEVTRAGTSDRLASHACELVARAFWGFAGNAVLAYGAWDGVFITGSLAGALRFVLRRPDLSDCFALRGPYARLLRETPRAFVRLDNGELAGAAQALLQTEPLQPASHPLAA